MKGAYLNFGHLFTRHPLSVFALTIVIYLIRIIFHMVGKNWIAENMVHNF